MQKIKKIKLSFFLLFSMQLFMRLNFNQFFDLHAIEIFHLKYTKIGLSNLTKHFYGQVSANNNFTIHFLSHFLICFFFHIFF